MEPTENSNNQNLLLLVCKQDDKDSLQRLKDIYELCAQRQEITCFSLQKLPFPKVKLIDQTHRDLLKEITFAVVVGDNETLLQVFSYFTYMNSPPILGIANGCMPILYNYTTLQFDEILELVFKQRLETIYPTQHLMKLSIQKDSQLSGEATCQIEIHRGMNQGILVLNLYLQNSCSKEKIKISQFRGDGLLISTPIGSYCKSMALNGPLMERNMENITITAMCPLSMKFRTLCLPASCRIFITIDDHCRTEAAEIYIDQVAGQLILKKGEQLSIRMSKYKTRMMANIMETPEEYYIKSLRSIVNWGQNNLEDNLIIMANQLQQRKLKEQVQKQLSYLKIKEGVDSKPNQRKIKEQGQEKLSQPKSKEGVYKNSNSHQSKEKIKEKLSQPKSNEVTHNFFKIKH